MKKNTSWKFTDESSVTFQSSVSGPGEFGLRKLELCYLLCNHFILKSARVVFWTKLCWIMYTRQETLQSFKSNNEFPIEFQGFFHLRASRARSCTTLITKTNQSRWSWLPLGTPFLTWIKLAFVCSTREEWGRRFMKKVHHFFMKINGYVSFEIWRCSTSGIKSEKSAIYRNGTVGFKGQIYLLP